MGGKLGISTQERKFINLRGGIASRPSDQLIEQLSEGKLFFTDARNVEYQKTGAIKSRRGYSQIGNRIDAGSVWVTTGAATTSLPEATDFAACQSFVPASTRNAAFITVTPFCVGDGQGLVTAKVVLKNNSAGSPGTTIATSNTLTIDNKVLSGLTPLTFVFSTAPSLTSGTTYWACLEMTRANSTITMGFGILGAGSGLKVTTDNYSSFVTIGSTYMALSIESTTPVGQGLWDCRFESAGALAQSIVANVAGSIYNLNSPSSPGAWTAIATGLQSGQNVLCDSAQLHNVRFFTDYANNNNKAWDGVVAGTPAQSMMTHGYRATFSAARGTATGTVPTGVYKLIAVTALISGGYRATAITTIDMTAGGTQRIELTSITADAIFGQFLFDIAATATTWFMTDANGEIYYKIPTANMSVAANPQANTTTAFNITATTNLTAANTLDQEFNLPQAFFTSQVATPKFKFLGVFQDMLCGGGDPNNPSRLWMSPAGMPQVWGTYGGLLGNYVDVDPEDGDILTGIKSNDTGKILYVGKNKTLHRITFTGNSTTPFFRTVVQGKLGVLSHWSMVNIPDGLYFLSESGPALSDGTTARLLPATELILDKFDLLDSASFNLSSMAFSTACYDPTLRQVWLGVSSNGAAFRDLVLVYDVQNQSFMIHDSIFGNFFQNIGDANGFPQISWVNYSGSMLQRAAIDNDNGSQILMRFKTPFLNLDSPSQWKTYTWLGMGGSESTTANTVACTSSVYLDGSGTVSRNITFTNGASSTEGLTKGQFQALAQLSRSIAFEFMHLSLNKSIEIDWIVFEYNVEGIRR